MRIEPFRGLRPRAASAATIPSVPYDVVSTEEARARAEGNPDSFLRVVRAEVELPADVDPYDDLVYERARHNLREMIADGRMVHDRNPAYYVYRLEVPGHRQTGIVAASSVDDYLGGKIRKHEFTRPRKEDDRVRHIDTVGAHCGPVLLTYRDDDGIDAVVDRITSGPADVDFTADDEVRHSLWVVDDPAVVADLLERFAAGPVTYIADGHHRAASAARVAAKRRERSGSGPWDRFLTILFPCGQMRVLEYNRLVRDLAGLDESTVLSRIVDAGFEVREDPTMQRPERPGTFGLVLGGGRWHSMRLTVTPRTTDPVESLDVAILSERVLQPILAIGDPRTDPRIEFVGGIRGPAELERRVASGEFAIGVALHPTRLADVLEVADAERVMPPKSTWFEPKARSGMVVLDLELP